MSSPSLWSPFRSSAYRIFWACAFLSNLGTWIQDVAASWLMTHLSASPFVVSLLSFSSNLPIMLFSVLAGFWADGGDRRRILLFSQWLMFAAALSLGVQASTQSLTAPSMLLWCFVMGVGVAMNGPSYQMVLSDLVPAHEQHGAVLLYYMGLNLTRVLGPALGGFLLGLFGPTCAFYLNAVSFVGLMIYYWRWSFAPRPRATKTWRERFAGLQPREWDFLLSPQNRRLWLEIFAVSFCASAMWALYPVRGRLELHLSSFQYGSLLGCLGVGAFVSAMFSDLLMHPQRSHHSLTFSYLVFAAGELILAKAFNYPMACLGMFCGGLGWIILATLMNMNTRQLSSAPHLKATMLGVFLSVFYFGMSAGSVTWGAIAKGFSTGHALAIASGVLLLISLTRIRQNFKESP